MYKSFKEINQEQKKELGYKIEEAVEAIAQGFAASKHNCAVAFSGGKDSTVLWHLIRTHFPDKKYKVIFGNTGVEFPESLKFARELGAKWGGSDFYEATPAKTEKDGLKYQAQKEVLRYLIDSGKLKTVLKPDGKLKSTAALERACPPELYEDFKRRNLIWKAGTTMNYWWCADQYGYPILGKAASKLTARRINIDCFLAYSKTTSEKDEIKEYYELLKNVKMSNHCCAILKKEPSERLQAELDVDVIFKGLMAEESQMRRLNFCTRGYLFESSRPHLGNDPFYHCNPLSIWTDSDIWEYIHRFNVPYSSLYDIEYLDHNGEFKKINRNGCIWCATDIAFRNNHLSVLRQTHPKLWETGMKLGLGDEIMNLQKYKSNGVPNMMNVLDSAEEVVDRRPCAFDDVAFHIEHNAVIDSLYDAEQD